MAEASHDLPVIIEIADIPARLVSELRAECSLEPLRFVLHQLTQFRLRGVHTILDRMAFSCSSPMIEVELLVSLAQDLALPLAGRSAVPKKFGTHLFSSECPGTVCTEILAHPRGAGLSDRLVKRIWLDISELETTISYGSELK